MINVRYLSYRPFTRSAVFAFFISFYAAVNLLPVITPYRYRYAIVCSINEWFVPAQVIPVTTYIRRSNK